MKVRDYTVEMVSHMNLNQMHEVGFQMHKARTALRKAPNRAETLALVDALIAECERRCHYIWDANWDAGVYDEEG